MSGDVDFKVPILEVPPDYLVGKAGAWLACRQASLTWDDAVARGTLGVLDLGPLRAVLERDDVLAAGTLMLQLLTGRYARHESHLQAIRFRHGMTPMYVGRCDGAIVLRWSSSSLAAIDARARDVTTRLSETARQLPTGRPGVVHIGFEAVDGDAVERVRYEKIRGTMARFDPGDKPLEFVYCHYLVPESPPTGGWAFEETVQHSRFSGDASRPLKDGFLVLPPGSVGREGPHWRA